MSIHIYAADNRLRSAYLLNNNPCSDIRKIKPLLDRLESERKRVQYFALDLCKPALEKSMRVLVPHYQHVRCFGLWGTWTDGLIWRNSIPCSFFFTSLGSTFGNEVFDNAVAGLQLCRDAMRTDDRMLLGIDTLQDKEKIWASYHDTEGQLEDVIRNGFRHSNQLLESEWYRDEDWEVKGVLEEQPTLKHFFVLTALRDITCRPLKIKFKVGDQIRCFEAWKHKPEIMQEQFAQAGLKALVNWTSGRETMSKF